MEKNYRFLIRLNELGRHQSGLAGGKAVNLGELFKIEGINVPGGFCVTTSAFKTLVSDHQLINSMLVKLSHLKIEDNINICSLCSSLRTEIEQLNVPKELEAEISDFLSGKDGQGFYAVRSSATAEDQPMASFAGQQDSYLNVVGIKSILHHIKKCWASLFTERAVIYRIQNNISHHEVGIAVVVQQMVNSAASGIVFTADPVTSNRSMVSINAGFGLGETIVAGKINPDHYLICKGEIIERKIAGKTMALYAAPSGGTILKDVTPENRYCQALSDEQIIELAQLGRRIEEHFGAPQDIEWCLADNRFYFVQSRPITTLFPVPAPIESIYGTLQSIEGYVVKNKRVYISVGHNQMMSDAMKPLGLSFFLMVTNAPMFVAGGRLFVDVTGQLALPESRKKLIETFRNADPLIADALLSISSREDFFPETQHVQNNGSALPQPDTFQANIENNPAIVEEQINSIQLSNQLLAKTIALKSGLALLDFIKDDMQELKRIVFDPKSMAVIMTAINASLWLNAKMNEWLGETNVADIISQSVSNNISSEMGLELLDLADKIRLYPEVVQYFEGINEELNPEALLKIEGGQETINAIAGYLDKFGMRCVGEIDITRMRLAEKPSMLVPLILSHIKNFEAGESARRFAVGKRNAENKEKDLLERLILLPGGEQKAEETKRVISYIRNFIGFREYPKYGKICRYFLYRKALLNEAAELVNAGVIKQLDDIYYLSFEELYDVIRSRFLDDAVIGQRKADHKFFEKLVPPRVITSDGEIISGRYADKNLPRGALIGLAVSSGIVEGRARIILRMEGIVLEKGDILVTRFTDPSWTPFFVTVKALVTEVGGLMTHGAVVAREYGLPAVVGVENATTLIRDGQRIRVNGTEGYVEVLEA
jgi:phosphoenolpyruvate synthase/pyruvate phosphate dikinase